MSSGTLYLFPVYSPTLKRTLDLTQEQLNFVGSAAHFGAFFSVFGGLFFDAFGARADAANRELAAAEESVRLRAESRDATRKRAEHLADEIGSSAVSEAHVADLERRADQAQRNFDERRAADAGAATLEAIEKNAEALATLDRRLAKLRQEQDLAALAGENATKTRLKRELSLIHI